MSPDIPMCGRQACPARMDKTSLKTAIEILEQAVRPYDYGMPRAMREGVAEVIEHLRACLLALPAMPKANKEKEK